MRLRERTTIQIAVVVLQQAVARAGDGPFQTAGVRLALRCLLPYFPDPRPLGELWEVAGQLQRYGRADDALAILGELKSDLRRRDMLATDAEIGRQAVAEGMKQYSRDREQERVAKRGNYWTPTPRRRPD